MAKSFKFKNDIYLDSSSVVFNNMTLDKYLTQDYIGLTLEDIKVGTDTVPDLEILNANIKCIGSITYIYLLLRTQTGLPSTLNGDYAAICRIPQKYAPKIKNGITTLCYTSTNYTYPHWNGVNPAASVAFCYFDASGIIYVRTHLTGQKVISIQTSY